MEIVKYLQLLQPITLRPTDDLQFLHVLELMCIDAAVLNYFSYLWRHLNYFDVVPKKHEMTYQLCSFVFKSNIRFIPDTLKITNHEHCDSFQQFALDVQ